MTPDNPKLAPSPLPPPGTTMEWTPKKVSSRGSLTTVLVTAVPAILVLIAVTVPMGYAVPKKTKAQQTRTLAVQIINAVKSYYTEYSRYPLPDDSVSAEATPLRTDARLTAVLMGTDTSLNPKRIRFLPDLKTVAQSGDFGLKTSGTDLSIVDAWGEPLYILLDADYSGEMENPDPTAERRTLAQGVLVFSAGPDKDPTTWEDNVASWTARPHR